MNALEKTLQDGSPNVGKKFTYTKPGSPSVGQKFTYTKPGNVW